MIINTLLNVSHSQVYVIEKIQNSISRVEICRKADEDFVRSRVLINVEEGLTESATEEMEIIGVRRNSYSRLFDGGDASLCPMSRDHAKFSRPFWTHFPNGPVSLIEKRYPTLNSSHRLPPSVYTNFCSFGCITHISIDGRWTSRNPLFAIFSRDGWMHPFASAASTHTRALPNGIEWTHRRCHLPFPKCITLHAKDRTRDMYR